MSDGRTGLDSFLESGLQASGTALALAEEAAFSAGIKDFAAGFIDLAAEVRRLAGEIGRLGSGIQRLGCNLHGSQNWRCS